LEPRIRQGTMTDQRISNYSLSSYSITSLDYQIYEMSYFRKDFKCYAVGYLFSEVFRVILM